MEFRYKLEQAPKKKGICPKCGQVNKFRFFYDTKTGDRMPEQFGRCERENNCGYILAPTKENFTNYNEYKPINNVQNISAPIIAPLKFVEKSDMIKSLNGYDKCNFTSFLFDRFGVEAVNIMLSTYRIGCKKESVLFWYVDLNGKIRTAKEMLYKTDGHRDKTKESYYCYTSTNGYKPCLFGEHLLINCKSDAIINIVESEKTAILASLYLPQYIWIATGGATMLTGEKMKVLAGRNIRLIPDLDKAGRINFEKKIPELKNIGCNAVLYDFLPVENNSCDIADYLLNENPVIELDNSKIDTMLNYLNDLKPEAWKPVKTQEAKTIIIHIMANYMNNIEFNADFTMIRKAIL